MLKRREFLLGSTSAMALGVNAANAFFTGFGTSGTPPPPTISNISPSNGTDLGGTPVTITGSGFNGVVQVFFGGTQAINVALVSANSLTCVTPAGTAGPVSVGVTNSTASAVLGSAFTYQFSVPTVASISPNTGASTGGTSVLVIGTEFVAGLTTVTIGSGSATAVNVTSPTTLSCVTPSSASVGATSVIVTTAAGSNAPNGLFTYTGGTGGVIASIPTGDPLFTFAPNPLSNGSSSGFGQANADGSAGWFAPAWTVIGLIFNFPANDIYQFTIPCYTNHPGAAFPANGVRLYIDQFVAQTVSPNTYYFDVFVSNASPAQNITFSCPVLAGNHEIVIEFLGVAPVHVSQGVHSDRLIITQTNTGLPAEPVGTRDPALFPLSSYHYLNSAIGSSAQWSLPTDSDTLALVNGLPDGRAGQSPAVVPSSLNINSQSFSSPIFVGNPSTDPLWTMTQPADNFDFPALPQPFNVSVHAPSNLSAATGGDSTLAVIDSSNSRYSYGGGAAINPTGSPANSIVFNKSLVVDSFSQNSGGTNQADGYVRGIIRVADIKSGVIAHTINIAICANITATVLSQKASGPSGQGLGWPVDECDFNGPFGEFTGGTGAIQWGALLGIPGSVNLNSLGLTSSLGMMVAVALQNYGANIEGQVGNYNSSIIMYAEYQVSQDATTTPLLNAWYSSGDNRRILAQMRILRGNTPAAFNNGYNGVGTPQFCKGGGTPRVPMLQGMPSISNYPSRHPASNAPVVTAVYPNAGFGGTLVAIVGTGFTGASAVNVGAGGAAVQSFTVISDTQINAYMAFHSNGTRPVLVTTPGGTSSGSVTFTHGITELASLPLNPDLPNPYLFNDGVTNVTTKAQWALRQFELRELWQSHWDGHFPPPAAVTLVGIVNDSTITTTIGSNNTMRNLQVNLQTSGPNGVIQFGFNMYIPLHSGGGPFPVLFAGEWAWSPLIAAPNSNMSASLGQNDLNTLVNRGYIIAEMSRDQFSLDDQDGYSLPGDTREAIFTTTASDDSQLVNPGPGSTGNGAGSPGVNPPSNQMYAAFPFDRNSKGANGGTTVTFPTYVSAGLNTPPSGCGGNSGYDLSCQACWTWGYMRCVDYLVQCSASAASGFNVPVDTTKICVTGISGGSGPPLKAAAFDTRIAVTLPNQGIGIYSGSRLCEHEGNMGTSGPPPPTINDPNDGSGEMDPFNNPRTACRYIGSAVTPTGSSTMVFQNYERVPCDTHTLMSMIAPRGFFTAGYIGAGGICSPRAQAQKFIAGLGAFAALGAAGVPQCNFKDNNAISGITNGHIMTTPQYTAMLDYLDHFFKGTALPADVTTPTGSKSFWCNTQANIVSKVAGSPVNGSTLTTNTACGFTWIPPTSLT